MTKLNDDIRILVALREGYDVVDQYKEGYGWSNPPVYYRGIEDRAQTVWRNISLSSIDRAVTNGLIEIDRERSGESFGRGHHRRHKLTEAGAIAAAALAVTIDQAMALPKPRPPKPPMTTEECKAAKQERYARSTLKYLAKGGRLVRADGKWICRHMDLPYVPPGRNSWYVSEDRNLPLIRHLVEEFVGCDGLPSLRITAAGAEIIAKRKPLRCA
ncbi:MULTISPECIES: hypothetical protein [Bradyrhizobium]|uniref:Uncharacterized protein n=1 Tax=Bradyrhizobium arachidis TaxID=858423 RepID=A0AAE7TFC2_9BRAD|nr:hypothetical protein [Bradyrhizobium arachidis]QOZ66385.1 hypothetical protein WN72_08190 [Bradyrhizobium arachidis]SFV18326.1 hypothetical protein SAMN05192541_13443 [Bradyrhizobium arachidis]